MVGCSAAAHVRTSRPFNAGLTVTFRGDPNSGNPCEKTGNAAEMRRTTSSVATRRLDSRYRPCCIARLPRSDRMCTHPTIDRRHMATILGPFTACGKNRPIFSAFERRGPNRWWNRGLAPGQADGLGAAAIGVIRVICGQFGGVPYCGVRRFCAATDSHVGYDPMTLMLETSGMRAVRHSPSWASSRWPSTSTWKT